MADRIDRSNRAKCLSRRWHRPSQTCAVSKTPCPRWTMWSSNGTTMAAGSVVMHPALRVCVGVLTSVCTVQSTVKCESVYDALCVGVPTH